MVSNSQRSISVAFAMTPLRTGRTPARTRHPRICISYGLRLLQVANSLSSNGASNQRSVLKRNFDPGRVGAAS